MRRLQITKWFLLLLCSVLFLSACGKADRFYKSGLQLMKENKVEEALQSFTKAIENNGERAEYYLERGFAYCKALKYEEARQDFERVILDIDLRLAKQNTKRAYRGIGITYYEENNYEKAKEYLELALAVNELPELDNDLFMYLADVYEQEGEYVHAIEVYNKILKTQEDYSDGYRARAYMEFVLSRYEESLKDYNKAIELEPKNLSLFFAKYNVLEKLKRTEEQKVLLQSIAAMDNKTKEDNYLIAKAQYFCGNDKQAEPLLKEAVENGFSDADFYLGELYMQRSNFQEALFHYNEYIKSEGKNDAAAYNQAAYCLLMLSRYEEANQMIQHGVAVSDNLTREKLAENEIIILEQLCKFNEAYEKSKTFHEMYPSNRKITEELKFLQTRVRETVNE